MVLCPMIFLAPAPSEAIWAGTEAPGFTLKNSAGEDVSLSRFKGKVVFLNFWASWCSPCKEELPKLNEFINKYSASDAVVLAINVDKKRSHADGFLEGVKPLSKNITLLFDPKSTVIPKYNAMAMPTSFIIDRKGVIRFFHFGYMSNDPKKWATEVDTLIKEQPAE